MHITTSASRARLGCLDTDLETSLQSFVVASNAQTSRGRRATKPGGNSDLPDQPPVLGRYATQHVQLSALHINLEQVDARERMFSDQI